MRDSPGLSGLFSRKQRQLDTDLTVFGQVADALRREFPNNRIHVNSNNKTIRIASISTRVVHEITVKRVL